MNKSAETDKNLAALRALATLLASNDRIPQDVADTALHAALALVEQHLRMQVVIAGALERIATLLAKPISPSIPDDLV